MLKNFTKTRATANRGSAMETRDHSKNGVSPKNQRSRRNLIIICLLSLVLCGAGNKAMGQTWNISDQTGTCGYSNVTAVLNQTNYTLTISGTGCMADFWCSMGGEAPWWPNHCAVIKTVIIESGVMNIGDRAFHNCINLESITIPNSVNIIGKQAFDSCTKLTTIIIPNSVTKIEGEAFKNCYALHTVIIDNGATNLNFVGYNSNQPCNPNATSDTYNWFAGCTSLKTLRLGRNLTNWHPSSSVSSPIYYIKNWLTTLIIGSPVTEIGNEAFNDCINLKNVEIEDKCTGNLRFVGIWGSTHGGHFLNTKIETLYLGRDLEAVNIGNVGTNGSPFANNSYLQSVTIGCCVTAINASSFEGCENLDSLFLCYEGKLESIGSSAFYGCSSLATPLNLPQGLITIDAAAFNYCSSLPSVFIPKTVLTIGNEAFNNCTNLKSVEIEDKCTGNLRFVGIWGSTHDGHFLNSRIETLYLGRDLEAANISNVGTNGSPFANNSYLKYVTIGCCVTKINDNSFKDCNNLESLTLCYDENLESIGSSAFSDCSSLATPLNLPQGVITIGAAAFKSCSNLPSVFIPKTVLTIGNEAFNYCTNLKTVKIEDKCTDNLRFVGIWGSTHDGHFLNSRIDTLYLGRDLEAANISNVGTNGSPFANNSYLKSVTIGNCVTKINDNSFHNCANISQITSYPCPHPIINNCNVFNGVSKNIPVILKDCACLTDYQTAQCWSEFANYQCFIPVTNIVLNVPTTITVGVPVTLSATVEPSNATNQDIIWSIEDAGTTGAEITGNILTTYADGNFIILATIIDGTRGNFTKTFGFSSVLGIADFTLSQITIYPNPTTGKVQITSDGLQIDDIEIFDIYSRKLLSFEPLVSPETTIDIAHFSAGVYFVKIHTKSGEVVRKVVKE